MATDFLTSFASAGADAETYGQSQTWMRGLEDITPLPGIAVEFGDIGVELVTAMVTIYRDDGSGSFAAVQAGGTDGPHPVLQITLSEEVSLIRSIEIAAKSSIEGSTARARLTLNAREG